MSTRQTTSPPSPPDNAELTRLFAEDQADRSPPIEQTDIDAVVARDVIRLARVREMLRDQVLRTGADYYHAAMILQHAAAPEDYLLAHELCVIAISMGEPRALWLAAASEDRYLMSTDQPQRFGTQYRLDRPDGTWRLYEVSPDVTDEMRRAFSVPPLSDAQARAKRMNAKSSY